MRRLISSRWVRLALAAAVTAVVVVAVLRLRRAPAGSEVRVSPRTPPSPRGAAGSDAVPGRETPVGAGPAGHPGGPPAAEAPAARKEVIRRRVVRWGSVVIALCVLVFATRAVERAVFSEETVPVAERFEEPPAPSATSADSSAAPSADSSGTAAEEDCRPGTETPAVREVDPRVTRAVNRQWRRIERWLEANAPRTHRTLSPPARARTIAIAEAQMGLRFPGDLRASLLRHNGSVLNKGSGLTIFLYEAMNVRDIRDTWRRLCGIGAGDRIGPRVGSWEGRMIPVGADGSGNHLVVDSIRRDVGRTGDEGETSFELGGVRIPSYHALLRMTADALERGGTVGQWRPVVDGGTLSWETVRN
ncbi:SMI1/KNR4 family protein [Planobispora takensis]|uniref:SMI1/KNR4 family protein n=1 Tax=Planobispora takensis TaxID=1367882 RepID=UPI001940F279|nr:SMI1/KNR4 family protein [Planobispora takensis]